MPISPDCKSCMYACNKACDKPCSRLSSPYLHPAGSSQCINIRRCSSPKPRNIPGCKWVKKCSPKINSVGAVVTSPVVFGRRRHTPYRVGHGFSRKISPYATTIIGRRRVGSKSPIGRRISYPVKRVVVSPNRRK